MLDYCPKQGKQNSKHKAHARRATRTRAPSATRRTPTPHGRHQPQGYTPQCRPQHAPTRPYSTVLSPSTSRETRTRTPNRAPAFEAGVSTIPPHWPCKCPTVFYGKLVPTVGLEPTRSHERHILSVVCLPIPPRRQNKRGAETNKRDNHTTTVRPTSGTHAHQPHHRLAQPACADTLNRPTQTGPTYSPTPRAPWRKHTSATRTHPAHHQCRHTPQRDSTRSREHPRVVSAPRSA